MTVISVKNSRQLWTGLGLWACTGVSSGTVDGSVVSLMGSIGRQFRIASGPAPAFQPAREAGCAGPVHDRLIADGVLGRQAFAPASAAALVDEPVGAAVEDLLEPR